MKNTMKLKFFITTCSLCLPAAVFAECPDSLSAEKMSECITVEGSGSNYQDWLNNEYQLNLEESTDKKLESMANASNK